jgi:hypothetical protein
VGIGKFLASSPNGRAEHEVCTGCRNSPPRITRSRNIICESLVDKNKVVLPPLNLRLCLKKQFTKALEKVGDYFKCICNKFPDLTCEKGKEGFLMGAQIRKLSSDEQFEETTG